MNGKTSQTVILMLFWGFVGSKEIVLVKNKEGTRKTETGEILKRAGWGGPGGKVEEGEVLLEAAKREMQEETSLTEEQVEIFPEVVAQIRKGNHFKKLLVGRVFDTRVSLKIETDEISKCRRFSLKSLPRGSAGIYNDHLELFQMARKELRIRGEEIPIIAVDEKLSGRIHPKDRSERSGFRKDGERGRDKGRNQGYGTRGTFERNQGNQRDDQKNRFEKPDKPVEKYIYQE